MQKLLEDFGLEEKEAIVYLALLKNPDITATRISQLTNLDRTLMYQITNRLIEKGLASYIIKNNVRYFTAADPETLVKILDEKKLQIENMLPDLKNIQKLQDQITKVEVFQGKKGIANMFKIMDMISHLPLIIYG